MIPKSLREKFSKYQGNTKLSEQGKILLRFRSIDSLNRDKYYELTVDTKKWRLAGLHVIQRNEPKNIKGRFLYTRKEGKWMVEETISSFLINGKNYSEKIEYKYKKIKSYWLLNKMRQTVKQDNNITLLYRFRCSDYKIN